MRTIKFRGKRVDNGEFVEGDLIHGVGSKFGKIFILPRLHIYPKDCNELDGYEVIPETVGQYINLEDIKGEEAFVGDIFIDERGAKRTIMFVNGGFATESNPVSFGYGEQKGTNPLESLSDQQTASWFSSTCRLIGNIHDNPDLLK